MNITNELLLLNIAQVLVEVLEDSTSLDLDSLSFILPGIPQYLRRGSDHLDSLCRNPDRQYYSRYIYLSKDEVSLAPVLNSAVKQFKDQVIFGSYPVVDHNYFTTQVTMESANQSSVDQAHQYLTSQIPSSDVIDYDPDAIAHATQSIQDIINDSANSNQLHLPVSSSFQVSYTFVPGLIYIYFLFFTFCYHNSVSHSADSFVIVAWLIMLLFWCWNGVGDLIWLWLNFRW